MRFRFLMLVAMLVSAACATKPTAHPSCRAIKVRDYFDGKETVAGQSVLVVEGRHFSSRDPSTCEETLDVRELNVVPGLIDAHTHVLLSDETYGKDFSLELERQSRRPMDARIEEAKVNLRSLLFSGFTTIRDLGNSGLFEDVGLETERTTPRVISSGPGLAFATAQFPKTARSSLVTSEYRIIEKTSDVADYVEQNRNRGLPLVKVYVDVDPQPGLIKAAWLEAVVKEAHFRRMRVAAHATTFEATRMAAQAGVDTIEHGYEISPRTAKMMAEKKIALVATDLGTKACEQIAKPGRSPDYAPCSKHLGIRGNRFREARLNGVPLAFGSDMYFKLESPLDTRGSATLDSLLAYHEYGLHPKEVIRTATSNAAEALGRDDIGVIKPGAYADLVAYRSNPTEDAEALRTPVWVMKGGNVVCSFSGPVPCR